MTVPHPFRNPDLSVAERVEDLRRRLTTEERIGQLQHESPAIERLGIPAYNWWNECLHGVGRAGIATVFPQAIGLAATFDTGLLHDVATAIGDEARAKHHEAARRGDRDYYKGLTYWTPNINIVRDPRWGRGQETYGEDPWLTARMGVAFVRGIQGSDPRHLKLVATPKHFAVHSGPEALRHEFDAIATARDMAETYLPHFRAVVQEARAEGVMAAYNRTNGEPCCASPTLLQRTLREEWGFAGHVVSDCGGVEDFHQHHGITETPEESAALALRNGCDLCCGCVYGHLGAALEQGLIAVEDIDRAFARMMTARTKLGMFDPPERVRWASIPFEVVDCEEHRALARRSAEASIVLLKNDGTLPLARDVGAILVVGPNADSRDVMFGNYSGTPSRSVTPLEGIRAAVAPGTKVWYAPGCAHTAENKPWLGANDRGIPEALAMAERCDAIVACLGISPQIEGEQGDAYNSEAAGDRTHLDLTGVQDELLAALLETGKPVVVVLMSGSALAATLAHERAAAVLHAWYPGEEGGTAIAGVLFGDVCPAGRLPVTFYRSVADLPDFRDYSMENRTYRFFRGEPLYPFGFGLSYTRFEYANLRVEPAECAPGQDVSLAIDVKNAGARDGDEVVQVYLRDDEATVRVPRHKLVAFARIHIPAGETRRVDLVVRASHFAVIDDDGTPRFEAGTFALTAGGSQPDGRSRDLGAAAWATAEIRLGD